jgi:ABC-2 type transport system ATP-binding protein
VTATDRHGESITLRCSDSDQAIRALLDSQSDVRDIEISGAALEDAFIQLTGGPDDEKEKAA